MNIKELLDIWGEVSPPQSSSELAARELSKGSGVWIALDHQGSEHLLIQVSSGARVNDIATHGLRVSVEQHRVEGQSEATYVDVACLDTSVRDTFGAVALELAEGSMGLPTQKRASWVVTALNRWKWFWGVDPARMAPSDALGLFGELWFLTRWAGVTQESVTAWNASSGSRHDFQWASRSVEVKTTAASGAVVHSIGDLDQLADAETGQLYLFSLKVTGDALARNTLGSLVGVVSDGLHQDPATRDDFWRKLAMRGYSPANPLSEERKYRVMDEALYLVADEFPRLTTRSFPSGLPNGIGSISYSLEMSACADWLCATSPAQWPRDTPAGR